MSIFIKDGYICWLDKEQYEPMEHFMERGNFVVSLKPENINSYNDAANYSRVIINVKYNGAKYNDDVMNKLISMSSNQYKS